MKIIMVGTDGNPRARAAVDLGADLASATGASLHLVAACAAPVVAAMPEMVAPPDISAVVDALAAELEGLADELRRNGLTVETHVSAGAPADVLCRTAEAIGADLLVVGNHRMHGAGRLLGSVANRVAHHAGCNVLIARTT